MYNSLDSHKLSLPHSQNHSVLMTNGVTKNWVILLEAAPNLDLRFLHANLGPANNSLEEGKMVSFLLWSCSWSCRRAFIPLKNWKTLSWTPPSQKHLFFCKWFEAWSSMIFSLLPPKFSVFLILTAKGCLFCFTASPVKFFYIGKRPHY